MPADSKLTAIAFACTGFALFAVMGALAKYLGDDFSTVQILLFRSLFALLPLAVLIARTPLVEAFKVKRPGLLVFRSAMGLFAMALFFAAVTVLPLAEVVALAFAAPIFSTLLGSVFLGERVGPHRWGAVVVGLLGVLIMVRPGTDLFTPWSLLPLGSALFYSVGVICVRTLSRTEPANTIVLYFSLIVIAVSGVAAPFAWHAPDRIVWVLLAAMGIVGGVMQLCSAHALKRAEVTVLAPFEYTSLLWSALLGFVIWREFPGAHLWLGALLVCASALYIVFREAKAKG